MSNILKFFPNKNANSYIRVDNNDSIPPFQKAIQHLKDCGFAPPFLQIGSMMRFPDKYDLEKGDKRGNAGWCIYTEATENDKTIGILNYGSWHDGSKDTWTSLSQDYMSDTQRNELFNSISAARALHEAELLRLRDTAKRESKEFFDILTEAKESHPYLVRKQVNPYGIKQHNENLVIPMYQGDEIVGIQTIFEDGTKRFKKHCSKGYFRIGDKTEKALVCEGYATGASLHEATGLCVYVAFDVGNIFQTVSFINSDHTVIICADDDKGKEINAGLTEAKRVSDALGCKFIVPETSGSDFNDMAVEKGIDYTRDFILSAIETKKIDKIEEKKEAIAYSRPNGVLGMIYDYYNATSGHQQYGFAVQCALAIGSLVCGRNFVTDNENFSSIYLLNVGETATGKEHCKTIITKILCATCMDNLIIGDGFTSAGGVMTELLRKPRCISVIDEFGMYLEGATVKGNTNQKEANSYLMQAIGRCQGMLLPKNYSGMSLSKKDADAINDKRVCNPALTLVGITTPTTFFESIRSKDIHSGFLNRFIISVSAAMPAVRSKVKPFPVPIPIIDWINAIDKRAKKKNSIEVSSEFAKQIVINISQPAWEIQEKFDEEMVQYMIDYIPSGLNGLFGRAAEMAHRVALICALSRDPNTEIISDVDMKWAVDYVRNSYRQMLEAAKKNMAVNQYNIDMNELMKFIDDRGGKASEKDIMRYFGKKTPSRIIDEMLNSLIRSEQLEKSISSGKGRPATIYTRTEWSS